MSHFIGVRKTENSKGFKSSLLVTDPEQKLMSQGHIPDGPQLVSCSSAQQGRVEAAMGGSQPPAPLLSLRVPGHVLCPLLAEQTV